MMRITIHDVAHGGCSVVTLPNGVRFMIDCGIHPDRLWYPSKAYAGQRIDTLVLSNLDEDHVQDLARVMEHVDLRAVFSNPTVDAQTLWEMKEENGMRAGVKSALLHLRQYGPGLVGPLPYAPNIEVKYFFVQHHYLNPTNLKTTNNLSVVTYVAWGDFAVLFGGDLETAGWRSLLALPAFRARLPSIRVFVASHHGRANGKCEELFNYMYPEIIVFSDGEKQHATQETTNWYKRRAKGIPVLWAHMLGVPRNTRWVYTTRADGTLNINVNWPGNWTITPTRDWWPQAA